MTATPHPPAPARPGTRRRRTSRPPTGPATAVWPHHPGGPPDTLAEIIRRHARPGRRVLLIPPPAAPADPTGPPTGPRAGPGREPDWAWHLTHPAPDLGRRHHIEVRTGPPGGPVSRTGPAPARTRPASRSGSKSGSGSGSGLVQGAGVAGPDPAGVPPGPTGPDRAGRTGRDDAGSVRADLVITAVDPVDPGRVHQLPWTGLLTPTGTLAVFTRCHRTGGRWVDPLPALTAALTAAGLIWTGHIAVLDPHLDGPGVADHPGDDQPAVTDARAGVHRPEPEPPVRHRPACTDLLMFRPARTPQPTRTGGGSHG